MSKNRETKKSYFAKLRSKQFHQTRKKNKTTKTVNLLRFESEKAHSSLIFGGATSIFSDGQLSPEQFDRAAHDAMLEMLSIDRNYYDQVSTYDKSV